MPRCSTVFSSRKLAYMAPRRCFRRALSPAAAASKRIACTSACAFSNSMMPMPALAYSAGNGVLVSQVPFTKRNRSSCGRTLRSIAEPSMPDASGAAVLSASAAPANEMHITAGSSLRRDIPASPVRKGADYKAAGRSTGSGPRPTVGHARPESIESGHRMSRGPPPQASSSGAASRRSGSRPVSARHRRTADQVSR